MDEEKLKDKNILLVKEKDNNELKAVAGIGKTVNWKRWKPMRDCLPVPDLQPQQPQ